MGQKVAAQVIVLDSGALIAFERRTERMRALVREAITSKVPVLIPAAVLAQVWRRPPDQVLLRSLAYSRSTKIVPLDGALAEAIGALCARTKTRDVVDASVAIVARQHRALVLTSDPDDILRLDSSLRVELV
jgi:predicted nucleic acid-binding protein